MKLSRAQRSARETFAQLRTAHPDAHCELDHRDAFELLVATVLSARNTDVMVNRVTPALFKRWPDAASLARARVESVEKAIGRLGMFRQKAKNLVGLAGRIAREHGGRVPGSLGALVELPGVGRKTANVVLGVAFGTSEGVVVDTHVQRLARRLGWSGQNSPDKIELDLMGLFPQADWDILSHTLIFHGRRVCTARKPACAACSVSRACPSAFAAATTGRSSAKKRTAKKGTAKKKRGAAKVKKATAKKRARR